MRLVQELTSANDLGQLLTVGSSEMVLRGGLHISVRAID